jgi:magnesium transporter
VEIRLIDMLGARSVPAAAAGELLGRDGFDSGFLWIDFDHTEQPAMALLTEVINARPEDILDCSARTPVPKIHPYADHLFSAINGVARGTDGRLHFQPLKVFLNERVIVTVLGPTHQGLTHEAAHRELTAIRGRIDAQDFRPASGLDLVTAIRFEMLRAQEELTGVAARSIAALEQRMMEADPVKAEALLRDLFELRHDLQTIGTSAAQTYESYDQLIMTLDTQAELMRVDPRRIKQLRRAYGHLKNTTDLEREYLQELVDLFQTRVSTELNRFVRKITAWGTVAIAWTVIAGIYGMNFVHMPELEWRYGYLYAFGVMAAVGLVLVFLFRRKGWM